jgi:antitoxin (DNA-binding transcriptional repressor) of toxin-antitoxin stability system
METISKSDFKAHALEVLREIEQSGSPRIITDRGRPTLEIRKLRRQLLDPRQVLKGTVVKYESPEAPVAEDDWENAE